MTEFYEIAICVRIVYFGNETYIIILFDERNDPIPEFNRYHFCHIASKAIYTFACPKKQNIAHFVPCIRNGRKMFGMAVYIIDSIVEFDCFVPVILVWKSIKAVITSRFCRKLTVFEVCLLSAERQ